MRSRLFHNTKKGARRSSRRKREKVNPHLLNSNPCKTRRAIISKKGGLRCGCRNRRYYTPPSLQSPPGGRKNHKGVKSKMEKLKLLIACIAVCALVISVLGCITSGKENIVTST